MRLTFSLLLLLCVFPAAAQQPDQSRRDLYGDVLPDGAVARMGTVRWRHDRWVNAIAFSPDGKILASGGADDRCRLWDVATGRQLFELAAESSVESVAYSPDGKILATGCYDKIILLWDAASGKQLRKLSAHIGQVSSLSFSPDGKILASAEAGTNGVTGAKVHFWDVATGNEINLIPETSAKIMAVAFSPDRKMLATGGDDF